MRDVAILVWEYHKKDNWFRDLISRAIVYFTGYRYTHVGVFFKGTLYDSTIWTDAKGKLRTGIRVSDGFYHDGRRADVCMVPEIPLPDFRVYNIERSLHTYVEGSRPYNVLKLIALMFVWPTRGFWKLLGWVPFNHDLYGEVCSGFVDEVFKNAGMDLIPRHYEGYTVPGQFVELYGWRRAALGELRQ